MKALHRLLRLLTVLPILISAVVLPLLPERIPAHYNLTGEIDRWGSRLEILILPVFCLVSGFLWERTLPKLTASDPRNHKPMLIGGCCVQATFFGLFVAMLLSSCSQFEMTAEPGKAISKILGVVLGLSLIPIGNILPKVKRNGVFGLRTKWSMANDTCWNLCQRAGGPRSCPDRNPDCHLQSGDFQPDFAEHRHARPDCGRQHRIGHPLLPNLEKARQATLRLIFFILHKRAVFGSL